MRNRTHFLDVQRDRLEELRAHLARRTDAVDRDLGRESERDSEERAIERENDQVLEALSEEGRRQLALIEQALESLDAGTYGACSRCGGDIAEARLEALPYAGTCSRCA